MHRIHKVTVSFTEEEYHQLKSRAGHQPIGSANVPGKRTTARPRRQYGSIAGHIRAMLQQTRPALTSDQFLLLSRLVSICGELSELVRRSEISGLLAVSVALSRTQERISRVLDEIDQQRGSLAATRKRAER